VLVERQQIGDDQIIVIRARSDKGAFVCHEISRSITNDIGYSVWLIGNTKFSELAGGAAPLHVHLSHVCARRAVVQECKELVEIRAQTLGSDFHGLIGQIAHPAGDAVALGGFDGIVAKADTLDPSMDDGMELLLVVGHSIILGLIYHLEV
jgi:hypothetical protein